MSVKVRQKDHSASGRNVVTLREERGEMVNQHIMAEHVGGERGGEGRLGWELSGRVLCSTTTSGGFRRKSERRQLRIRQLGCMPFEECRI